LILTLKITFNSFIKYTQTKSELIELNIQKLIMQTEVGRILEHRGFTPEEVKIIEEKQREFKPSSEENLEEKERESEHWPESKQNKEIQQEEKKTEDFPKDLGKTHLKKLKEAITYRCKDLGMDERFAEKVKRALEAYLLS